MWNEIVRCASDSRLRTLKLPSSESRSGTCRNALTNTHAHEHTHSRTHTLTNARTHEHTHSQTHTLTNTHTHERMHSRTHTHSHSLNHLNPFMSCRHYIIQNQLCK